jgi:N-acetylneuraminic acid mutarotase
LYDPAAQQFTRIADMNAERVCGEAVLLPDGKVLIIGGSGGDGGKSAEVFDPATNTFARTGSMNESRQEPFAAVLLKNGKVLVTGGYYGKLVAGAELYDPATGQFTKIGEMTTGRGNHTMTVLPDGRVLIAGGGIAEPDWGPMVVLSSAEIFDPATNKFTPTGSMAVKRYKHGAVLLPDGKVLVVAGSDERQLQGLYTEAELYDPATGKFSPAGNLAVARYKILDSVVLLPNGKVLISGGAEAVEMYDPKAGAFSHVEGGVDSAAYFFQAASLLPDGSVLITGGNSAGFVATKGAWLYRP